MNWDEYFIGFARWASQKSKDRSSKVGCVLVKDNRNLLTGYNGFPSGADDDVEERHQRPLKYAWTVHAEENAIALAARFGISCDGATAYVTPFHPCSRCARMLAQAGIKEIIVDQQVENPRYEEDFVIAKQILDSAGILVRTVL